MPKVYDENSIFSVPDPKCLKVHVAKWGHSRRVFPFAEMRTGDYFEVIGEDAAASARSSARKYGEPQDKEFTVRRCPERKGYWICRRML